MPMGLTNACATFLRLMNKVLDGLIGKICFVCMDDIIVFSKTADKHLEHVRQVIRRLRNAKLKIKLIKCRFVQSRIKYLSHIVENGKIYPNPEKVQAIKNWKVLTMLCDLQSFLG